MAVTLQRLKEIISDIILLSSKIALLQKDMGELRAIHQEINTLAQSLQQKPHIPTPEEIREEQRQYAAEAELQQIIVQHEGLLDYLISTFPWAENDSTSQLDQLFKNPPISKTEQEKLKIIIESTLKAEAGKSQGSSVSKFSVADHLDKSLAIYTSHAECNSESSVKHFPQKGLPWEDIPPRVSKVTHQLIETGQVTRHFEYMECLSSALKKIENQIEWAQFFNQSEKLAELIAIKTLLLNTTYDNETSLITGLATHASNPIAADLMIDFKIIASDVKVTEYRAFQNSLLDIKNKISSSTDPAKVTVLNELVVMINAIQPEQVSKTALAQLTTDIIVWKNKNNAVLGAHRHGADIGLTESQRLVNYLIASLRPIVLDKNVTQYCEFQRRLAHHAQEIQNKIYWLRWSPFYSEKAEKITALQNLLNQLNNLTETTLDHLDETLINWQNQNDATLHKPRIKGSITPTQSQALVNNLIVNLSPVTANPNINTYAQYQTRLKPSIEKINKQIRWLNFYWVLCFAFKFMNRTTTLDLLNEKMTAFNALLVSIYAIKIDNAAVFKTTIFSPWRSQYDNTLKAHTFASTTSENQTASTLILNELSTNLDEIDVSPESASKTRLIN